MTARLLTGLKAAAIVGLGAFYLGLAVLSAHPRVSAEYRDHYLDRRADCWLSDALAADGPALPRTVSLAGMPYRESCRFLREGFLVPDADGVWARPGTATLRLPWRGDAREAVLALRAPPAALTVTVAGPGDVPPVVTRLDPGASADVTVPLPPHPAGQAWQLTLRTAGTGTVPRDSVAVPTQQVGVGLRAITYVP